MRYGIGSPGTPPNTSSTVPITDEGDLSHILFTGRQFVTAGQFGLVFRSTDLENWTLIPGLSEFRNVEDVAAWQGRIVVLIDNELFQVAEDDLKPENTVSFQRMADLADIVGKDFSPTALLTTDDGLYLFGNDGSGTDRAVLWTAVNKSPVAVTLSGVGLPPHPSSISYAVKFTLSATWARSRSAPLSPRARP